MEKVRIALVGERDEAVPAHGGIPPIEYRCRYGLATLFPPARAAFKGTVSPLVKAFVQACAQASSAA